MEYPSLEFNQMLIEFGEIRMAMAQKMEKHPQAIDGVNTGELEQADYDTSEWFQK